MKKAGKYLWQCLVGHVGAVVEGSELEKKCIERKASDEGAVGLSLEECPECIEDKRERLRHDQRLCDEVGCPMMDDDCGLGCLVELDRREFETRIQTKEHITQDVMGLPYSSAA